MSTAAQLVANQANAKLSTGPKTPEGKATSSQNSFRHGCTGRFMLLPFEDHQEFQELKTALFAQHQPANPTEHLLVERLVEHFWLGQRAMRLQATAFEDGLSCLDEKKLALYLRYQTTNDRAFHKTLATLQSLQKTRRATQSATSTSISSLSPQPTQNPTTRTATTQNPTTHNRAVSVSELNETPSAIPSSNLDHISQKHHKSAA